MGIEKEPEEVSKEDLKPKPKRKKKEKGLRRQHIHFQVPEEIQAQLDEAELMGKGRFPEEQD